MIPFYMLLSVFVSGFQQREDQRHSDIDAVLCLLEIDGPRIVVHLYGDLVDTRKRVQHEHVLFREIHLFFVENVEVFEADIVLFIKKALPLHSGHVEQIQPGDAVLEADDFLIGDAPLGEHVGDIVRHFKLRRGNEDKVDAGIADQRIDQ